MAKSTKMIDRLEASTTGHTAGVKASGTITVDTVPSDGDTLTLDDGISTPLVLEFDPSADGVSGGNTAVLTAGLTTAAQVARAIKDIINRQTDDTLAYVATTPTDGSAVITLTNRWAGTRGNGTLFAESASNFTFVQPTGGTEIPGVGEVVRPMALRDQTGYLQLSVESGTANSGTLQVQGRMDERANWVTYFTIDLSAATWAQDDTYVNTNGGISDAIPLMPEMRINVSSGIAASSVLSVWLLE